MDDTETVEPPVDRRPVERLVRSLREWSQGPMAMNPENADTCNELEAAAVMLEQLRDLVRHCWIHSGYRNCGRCEMGTMLGRLYDGIVCSGITAEED